MNDTQRLELASLLERLAMLTRRLDARAEHSLTSVATLATLVSTGPKRLTELAGIEGITQPGMSQVVARLEQAGLIQRVADPADGRAVLVTATPAAARLLAERRQRRAALLADLLAALPPGDAETLTTATPALRRLLDLSQSTPPRKGSPAR